MVEAWVFVAVGASVVAVVGGFIAWRLSKMPRPYRQLLATKQNPYVTSDMVTDDAVPEYDALLRKSKATLYVVRARTVVPKPYADASLALPFDRATELMKAGDLALENGIARCGDGSVFVASRASMPRCSGVMLQWWFTFCDRATLYRLWHPEDHVWCTWNAEYMATATAARQPGHERGNSHIVVEHMGRFSGGPAEDLHIDFKDPAQWGFTPQALQAASVRFITCMEVHVRREPGLGHLRTGYVVHIARDDASTGGVLLRSRFWLAKDVRVVGNPIFLPTAVANWVVSRKFAKLASLPMSRAASVWRHATEEFSVLANVLPEVFNACASPAWKARHAAVATPVPQPSSAATATSAAAAEAKPSAAAKPSS